MKLENLDKDKITVRKYYEADCGHLALIRGGEAEVKEYKGEIVCLPCYKKIQEILGKKTIGAPIDLTHPGR